MLILCVYSYVMSIDPYNRIHTHHSTFSILVSFPFLFLNGYVVNRKEKENENSRRLLPPFRYLPSMKMPGYDDTNGFLPYPREKEEGKDTRTLFTKIRPTIKKKFVLNTCTPNCHGEAKCIIYYSINDAL